VNYEKYYVLWLSIAIKITRNSQDAEEVVQDAVIRMIRFKNQMNKNEKSWSCKIVYRTALNHIRTRKIQINIDDIQIPEECDIEEKMDYRLLSSEIDKAILDLPPKQKAVMRSTNNGNKIKDVSIALQMDYEACKSLKFHATKRLKKKLKYLSE